jgi:hypothetical protein
MLPAIVWLDVGSPLTTGPTAPLSMPLRRTEDIWQVRYLPVIQYKPGVGLRSKSKLLAPVSTAQRGQSALVQSAALLHLDYGRSLDRQLMASDSFYLLHDLFLFAAFSEAQFLNMLETKLERELEQSTLVGEKSAALSNLVYHQRILDRHIDLLRENLASISERITQYETRNPQKDDNVQDARTATESLRADYQYLLSQALKLMNQCDRGVQVVMNNAIIKESREAMVQAEGVVKLTRLAFVFIPLSFTTSFFGMNFSEFGTGDLAIWLWFAVSLPIVAIALLLMRYDVALVWRRHRASKAKP